MRKQACIVLLVLALFIVGCGTASRRALETPEEALKTNNQTTMLFHSTLYYPSEISLNFPGFIVGIEKSYVDDVSVRSDRTVHAIPEAGITKEEAYDEIVDRKIVYISHIVESRFNEYGIGNCSIYNAYDMKGDKKVDQLTQACEGFKHAPVEPVEAYKNSWDALDDLKEAMKQRFQERAQDPSRKFTHIVVVTMGWNTDQEKAVRNFNSIIKNIKLAGGDQFVPLFVGVTWPSQWESDWLGPLVRAVSFGTKKEDADEVGMSWLGVLLHDTIPKVNSGLPVVVIGHSFGSRAASVAACIGPVISTDDSAILTTEIDYLINFQGAFAIGRLTGEKNPDRDIVFPNKCGNVKKISLTSSKHDAAMDTAFWGYYAGNNKSYDKVCSDAKKYGINCATADENGTYTMVPSNGRRITFVNADALIYQNAYLSGGGAHSDIYREAHGRLTWQLMQEPAN